MQNKRSWWFILVIVLWFATAGFGVAVGNCFHRVCKAVEMSMIETISHELLASTVLYGLATVVTLSCACVTTTVFMLKRPLG